jgi:predicted Zn finger-like uncharacterized protein
MADASAYFDCPNCKVQYKLVRAELGSETVPDKQVECRKCGTPFQGRRGHFILKYVPLGGSK